MAKDAEHIFKYILATWKFSFRELFFFQFVVSLTDSMASVSSLYFFTCLYILGIKPAMAILGCQLGYVWHELQSTNGGHPCHQDLEVGTGVFDLDLEVGRHTPLI